MKLRFRSMSVMPAALASSVLNAQAQVGALKPETIDNTDADPR